MILFANYSRVELDKAKLISLYSREKPMFFEPVTKQVVPGISNYFNLCRLSLMLSDILEGGAHFSIVDGEECLSVYRLLRDKSCFYNTALVSLTDKWVVIKHSM